METPFNRYVRRQSLVLYTDIGTCALHHMPRGVRFILQPSTQPWNQIISSLISRNQSVCVVDKKHTNLSAKQLSGTED